MKLLLVRSIPVSLDTKRAWRAAGAKFMRRTREFNTLSQLPFDVILNLGDSSFNAMDDLPLKWWNLGANVHKFRSPIDMRKYFEDLIPPVPDMDSVDWWHKQYGRSGSGNAHITDRKFGDTPVLMPGDFQENIVGTEYRFTTVGNRIVQQHMRVDTGTDNNRSYKWVINDDVPHGIRPLVKEAVMRVPGHNVIAWDTIIAEDSQPYILEGNASPGMNKATAIRVVTEIARQREEASA